MADIPELPMVLNIVEFIILLATFSSGIAVATLIGNSEDDFKGDCVLYADVNYTSPTYFRVAPGNIGKCSYCVGLQSIAVICAILYALYRAVVFVTKKYDLAGLRFVCVPVYALFTFMVLIQAFIVSVGMKHFCNQLKSEPTYADKDCRLFQTVEWRFYTGNRFYDTLKMAEGASWVNFFCWCALLVLSIFSAYKYRQYAKMNSAIVSE